MAAAIVNVVKKIYDISDEIILLLEQTKQCCQHKSVLVKQQMDVV
jgi:hypothetical protein